MAGPERMHPWSLGDGEYRALAAWIRDGSLPDVVFLGTSRGREAIVVPYARARLEEALGTSVEVANFSLAGARVAEQLQVVRALLRRRAREGDPGGGPRLIAYGMTQRSLLGEFERERVQSYFFGFDDWRRQVAVDADRWRSVWPEIARNVLGGPYRTLRYRTRLEAAIDDVFELWKYERDGPSGPAAAWAVPRSWLDVATLAPIRSPQLGMLTPWQRASRIRSLETHPVMPETLAAYVASLSEDGVYSLSDRKFEQLRELVRRVQAAGIRFVAFELPLSDQLLGALPPQVPQEFRTRMTELALSEGFDFVTLEQLDVAFSPGEYREPSHLNIVGALRMTDVVVERVLAPRISSGRKAGEEPRSLVRSGRP